jgi:hypothetical protein
MRILVSIFIGTASMAAGYIVPAPMSIKPGLKQRVDAQTETRLNINLEIGTKPDEVRLAVKGLVIDLFPNPTDYEHVPMPGVDGPNPKLSSGVRKLNIVEEGYFITSTGAEMVQTTKGCWEMVWRKDSPAGSLLCGFEVPKEYKRNDAILPKGGIYLSFPVWTKDTLAFARIEKARILAGAKECIDDKNEEMAKMQATDNILEKAWHYRKAYAAAEKYLCQPLKSMEMVPDKDGVIALQDDLFLTTKGTVWLKVLPFGKQVLLGSTSAALVTVTAE